MKPPSFLPDVFHVIVYEECVFSNLAVLRQMF